MGPRSYGGKEDISLVRFLEKYAATREVKAGIGVVYLLSEIL